MNGVSGGQRGRKTYRQFGNDLSLARTDEHATIGFAGKILDTLYRSVVLASRFVQFDSEPFASEKRGSARDI